MKRRKINRISRHLPWKKALGRFFRFFWVLRAKWIARHILSEIPEGATVLDIGAGSGLIAELLKKERQAKVTLLDVVDWNISNLPLTLFNGKKIPFENNQFDIVLLIDVVHHSENESLLIEEAIRVAKKVVIVEDQYERDISKIIAGFTDNLQIILYGMPAGSHHRNTGQWLALFEQYSPKVRYVRKYWRHSVFTIEPPT